MSKKCVTLFILLTIFTSSCQSQKLIYPSVSSEPVTENIHGIRIFDLYRNIENTDSPDITKWFEKQSSFTDSILASYGSVDAIEAKIDSLNMATTTFAYSVKIDDHGNLYYLKYREGDSNYLLFSKNRQTGKETLLFDPLDYKEKSGNEYYIDYFQPSWNGKYIAISVRYSNELTSEVIILEKEGKKLLEDLIMNSRPINFGGVNWLPDSSGFTYLYFPVADKEQKGYMTNSETRIHIINTPSDKDNNVFSSEHVKVGPNFFPFISITSCNDRFAIGHVMENPHYYDTYFISIESLKSKAPQWKKLYSKEDFVYINAGKQKAGKYYFISAKDATNFKLEYMNLGVDNIKKAIPIQNKIEGEVIKDFTLVDDGLYFTTVKNGIQSQLYYYNQEKVQKVQLPFVAGSLDILPNNNKGNEIIVELSGWANDLTRHIVHEGEIGDNLILAETPVIDDYEDLQSEEIVITGHDGVEIPVSIIYSKKLGKMNMPALIRSYGSYGHNIDPHYDRMLLSWITLGGIHVIPHIRGGGEKGKEWHDAGKKKTKSNSWKDIISTTEYLIREGYTTKDKTILFSESAGAISQGMAAIERPELFKVFLARVPLLNPTRLKSGSHEQTSYVEFGDIDIAEEVEALVAMDPYYNLNKDVPFPATLLLVAGNDDRLDLWEAGKFIAKLQNDVMTPSPKLLKVMPEWGHESVSAEGYALLFGFALQQIQQ